MIIVEMLGLSDVQSAMDTEMHRYLQGLGYRMYSRLLFSVICVYGKAYLKNRLAQINKTDRPYTTKKCRPPPSGGILGDHSSG
jgi:hypothetical protein